ncbi:T9SS type B sorting domain-containing protein [Flavobacterium sp. WV_118_3]|uniref:T9SS type B sorting domain-containing protein n=1 Tax=Flavobacterium sp. WV_118_3 TaxID=3151764 RepID=UPI00321C16DF
MKKLLLVLLTFVLYGSLQAQNQPNDCVNAINVCGNGTFSSNASGIGAIQEVSGCGGAEHNSIWLKINVIQSGTLGFNIIPHDSNITVDYDFWVYGPNRTCSNLGSPIRCATTNPLLAGQLNNHTGMNGSTTLTQTGPGANGNSYVRWLTVTAGQSYYIAIDRPVGDGGFDLEWIGTATDNGGAFAPPPTANPVPDYKTCSNTPNIGLFDLNSIRSQINADLTNNTVSFYGTLANANDGIAPLPGIIANTTNPQTIYATVKNNTTGCYTITQFNLMVYPVPTASLTVPASVICSGDAAAITFTGTPDATVEYNVNGGPTQTGLLNASGTLTVTHNLTAATTYTLTSVKVLDNNGVMLCSQPFNTSVTITVNPLPTASISGTTTICSGDTAPVTFTGTPNSTVTYTFNNGTNQQLLLDASGTATVLAGTAGIYELVRVTTSGLPACSQDLTGSVTITANPLPTASITGTTSTCSNTTGILTINGTPNATVTYSANGQPDETITLDAVGTATITTPVLTASVTYTLIRVTSADTPACNQPLATSHTITVITAPVITTPTPFQMCDAGNGLAVFDLTTKINEITGGNTGLTVTFHESQVEANSGSNPKGPLYTNNTPNTQTLYIRVVDSANNQCPSFTTLILNVTPVPQINPNVTPFIVCETSIPGDGMELFDLTVKDAQLLNGQTGVTVRYFESESNALSGSSPIIPVTAYPNMSNPETIWYQLSNATGCKTIGSFQLIVNPKPVIVPLNPMNACSNGSNTTAEFNLSLNNALVTGGVTGMEVTYHLTQTDADSGLSPLPVLYTSGPATIYVRVKNPATGCYATTTLDLNITQGPVAIMPQPMRYCDPSDDGVGTFDLHAAIPEITGGTLPPGVTVTFHETPEDAQLGLNALSSPYSNIQPWGQTIYVRVRYALTDCATIVMLQLIVDRTPRATAPTPLMVCDDAVADGITVFDLSVKNNEILGTLNAVDHTISYYESLTNAQTVTSPIGNLFNYTNLSNPQIIFVRIENNVTGCFAIEELQLIVNPLPTVPNPVPAYTLCDYTGQSLYEQFDLSTKIPEIIGTTTGLEVKFYKTQVLANAGTAGTELPTLYTNEVATVQTIFVRVTNSTTGCYTVTAMDLRVEPLPVLVMPTAPVTTCDGTNNDGIGDFDLTTLIPGMLSGEANVVLSFHETQQNAQNGLFPITVQPYQNINPWTQTLWVLATNTVTGCKSVYSFNLLVEPAPIMPTLLDLAECDTDSNPHDNQTMFDLTVHTATILAAQPGAASDYEVNYYISQTNAQNGSPFIVSNGNFIGTNGQTIWVRVTHKATGCFTIGSFKLIVNSPLQLTQPDEITLCDDALPNDQHQIFDLTIREAQITGGATGYTFNYYSSTALPPNPATLITDPTAFHNTATVQTLLVGVVSGAGCSSYVTLTIRVTPLPEPKFDPAPLVTCDDDYPGDGITFFDVTQNASYILNNANYVLTYHPTQADALAGINAIATPTNWQNMDANGNALTSVWVRVTTAPANNRDRCSLVVEQPLIVNPRPAAGPVTDYHMCQIPFTGSGVFDLSTKTPEALAGQGPAGYTVSYHANQADADTGANPLATSHPSTVNGETIYVRVVNTATGCYNTTSFQLFVERGSEATDVADIDRCDDLNDQTETFNLNDLDATILGPVQAADPNFSVSYYASDADLANGTPIGTPGAYTITDYLTHEIIAVVKNTYSAYGCPAEIRFNITVHRLPEPTPNAGFVCIDQETGTVLSTHIINSGLDATTHTFQWYENDAAGVPQPIAGATGATYEVNHPGTFSVIATSIATGCPSLPASVVITQSEPAEVTAYVSNAFTDNQSITVEAIGIGEYVYQLDEGDIQTSPVFTNVSSGSHTVTVYDNKGCATVTIPVTAINYPHYFTPNGDGYHDFWNIGDLENDANAKIYIFDRYGKLLKQIKPSRSTGWDGTMNGQQLPSTDYWFTVTYTENGDIKEFKAHFSLKR